MIGTKDRYALVTGASSGIGYELGETVKLPLGMGPQLPRQDQDEHTTFITA